MSGNLLILGAGMFGAVVKEIADGMNTFEKIDFLDDAFSPGENEDASRVHPVGKLEDYRKFISDYPNAIVSIGNPQIRKEWTGKLTAAGFTVPAVVSPRSYVSPSATLGKGAVVCATAVVNANAGVGEGSFITAGAIVDHNAIVAGYCNIQCGAVVTPGASVPEFTKTQPNEVIRKPDV